MIKTFPFITLFALLVCSCGVGTRSFYVLTADGPAPSGGGDAIGVGPVMVAEYADRPNLVMAESGNRLAVSDDHRWAGDVGSAVARVTATNLGRRWGTGQLRTYPWRNEDGLRKQITIDIRQFHGDIARIFPARPPPSGIPHLHRLRTAHG